MKKNNVLIYRFMVLMEIVLIVQMVLNQINLNKVVYVTVMIERNISKKAMYVSNVKTTPEHKMIIRSVWLTYVLMELL